MPGYSRKGWVVLGMAVLSLAVIGGKPQAPQVPLTPREEQLAAQTGFGPDIVRMVKGVALANVHRMIGYDANGYQITVNGLSVSVPENQTEQVLAALRQELGSKNYMAFVIEMNEGIKSDKIGVLKGTDQYEILRVMQTNGEDLDITADDVIERLMEWGKRYPLTIIGADNDWVEIEFKTAPADLRAFAQEVYDFCPDVLEQDSGSMEGLISQIRTTKRLLLWWDH